MGLSDADDTALNYWKMSYGRRLRRDLWTAAVGLPAMGLLAWATGWDLAPIISLLVVVLAVTTFLNSRMYRGERRVAARLADGTSTAWRMLAVVVSGKPQPVQWATTYLLAGGDAYEVLVNGRRYAAGATRVVADGAVREIDVCPDAGRVVAQISRADGDVLTACAAEPDAPRPTAFTSPPAAGTP